EAIADLPKILEETIRKVRQQFPQVGKALDASKNKVRAFVGNSPPVQDIWTSFETDSFRHKGNIYVAPPMAEDRAALMEEILFQWTMQLGFPEEFSYHFVLVVNGKEKDADMKAYALRWADQIAAKEKKRPANPKKGSSSLARKAIWSLAVVGIAAGVVTAYRVSRQTEKAAETPSVVQPADSKTLLAAAQRALQRLGYGAQDIADLTGQFRALFEEVNLAGFQARLVAADTQTRIAVLHELVQALDAKGYRDIKNPKPLNQALINRLLTVDVYQSVGGDIFAYIDSEPRLNAEQKRQLKERAVACTCLTTLNYVILSAIEVPGLSDRIVIAQAPEHIFNLIDLGGGKYLFADLSYGVVRIVDVGSRYEGNAYLGLKKENRLGKEQLQNLTRMIEQGQLSFEKIAALDEKELLTMVYTYLRLSPDTKTVVASILGGLATTWTEAGDWRKADEIGRAVLAMNPGDAAMYANLGIAAGRRGDFEEARVNLEKAVQLNPYAAGYHQQLGVALGRLDRVSEARTVLEKALELDADNARTHYLLGVAKSRLGLREQAIANYTRAVILEPSWTNSLAPETREAVRQKVEQIKRSNDKGGDKGRNPAGPNLSVRMMWIAGETSTDMRPEEQRLFMVTITPQGGVTVEGDTEEGKEAVEYIFRRGAEQHRRLVARLPGPLVFLVTVNGNLETAARTISLREVHLHPKTLRGPPQVGEEHLRALQEIAGFDELHHLLDLNLGLNKGRDVVHQELVGHIDAAENNFLKSRLITLFHTSAGYQPEEELAYLLAVPSAADAPAHEGDSLKKRRSSGPFSLTETEAQQSRDGRKRAPIMRGHSSIPSRPWTELQGEWVIQELRYYPQNIRHSGLRNSRGKPADEFGDYPDWVYVLYNTTKHEGPASFHQPVYVGPDDIWYLFGSRPERDQAIQDMRDKKEAELTENRNRFERLKRLNEWLKWPVALDIQAFAGQLQTNGKPFRPEQREAIEREYAKAERSWATVMSQVPLDDFFGIIHSLKKTIGRKIVYITPAEADRLRQLVERLEQAQVSEQDAPLTSDDQKFLLELYRRLRGIQKIVEHAAIKWAKKQATPVTPEQEALTPAYHAVIWIADYIREHVLPSCPTCPAILDVGSNIGEFKAHFRQRLSDDQKPAADRVVGLERHPEIYSLDKSLKRVRADIGVLNDLHLPRVEEAADSDARRMVEAAPHQFDIIIASFVLDQVETSDKVRQALVAFEHLLAKPEAGREPLLMIAMPEHAPLFNSSFDQALRKIGYRLVVHYPFEVNRVTDEAKQRWIGDFGPEIARRMEHATAKPFHAAVYAKERSVAGDEINRLQEHELILRQAQKRRVNRQETDGTVNGRGQFLDVDLLEVISHLNAIRLNDFMTQAVGSIVPRSRLTNEERYEWFRTSIATLELFRGQLTGPERRRLDQVVAFFTEALDTYLPESVVTFVEQRTRALENRKMYTVTEVRAVLSEYAPEFDYFARHAQEILDEMRQITGQAGLQIPAPLETKFTIGSINSIIAHSQRRMNKRPSIGETKLPPVLARRVSLQYAIGDLRAENRNPTSVWVAFLAGMSHQELLAWAEDNGVSLELLGVEVRPALPETEVGMDTAREFEKQVETFLRNRPQSQLVSDEEILERVMADYPESGFAQMTDGRKKDLLANLRRLLSPNRAPSVIEREVRKLIERTFPAFGGRSSLALRLIAAFKPGQAQALGRPAEIVAICEPNMYAETVHRSRGILRRIIATARETKRPVVLVFADNRAPGATAQKLRSDYRNLSLPMRADSDKFRAEVHAFRRQLGDDFSPENIRRVAQRLPAHSTFVEAYRNYNAMAEEKAARGSIIYTTPEEENSPELKHRRAWQTELDRARGEHVRIRPAPMPFEAWLAELLVIANVMELAEQTGVGKETQIDRTVLNVQLQNPFLMAVSQQLAFDALTGMIDEERAKGLGDAIFVVIYRDAYYPLFEQLEPAEYRVLAGLLGTILEVAQERPDYVLAHDRLNRDDTSRPLNLDEGKYLGHLITYVLAMQQEKQRQQTILPEEYWARMRTAMTPHYGGELLQALRGQIHPVTPRVVEHGTVLGLRPERFAALQEAQRQGRDREFIAQEADQEEDDLEAFAAQFPDGRNNPAVLAEFIRWHQEQVIVFINGKFELIKTEPIHLERLAELFRAGREAHRLHNLAISRPVYTWTLGDQIDDARAMLATAHRARPEPARVAQLSEQSIQIASGLTEQQWGRLTGSMTLTVELPNILRGLREVIKENLTNLAALPFVWIAGRDAEIVYDALKTIFAGTEIEQRIILLPASMLLLDELSARAGVNQYNQRVIDTLPQEFLARFGMTEEFIKTRGNKRILLLDAGFLGNVRGRLYGIIHGAFPHLRNEISGIIDDKLVSRLAEKIFYGWDRPVLEKMFPKTIRFTTSRDGVYLLAAAMQMLPHAHGHYAYEPRHLVATLAEEREEDLDLTARRGGVTNVNASVVNPAAAMLVQKRVVEYFRGVYSPLAVALAGETPDSNSHQLITREAFLAQAQEITASLSTQKEPTVAIRGAQNGRDGVEEFWREQMGRQGNAFEHGAFNGHYPDEAVRFVAEHLKRAAQAAGRVLNIVDAGAGRTAYLLTRIQEELPGLIAKFTAVDLDATGRNAAALAARGISFVRGHIQDLPLSDNSVDILLSTFTLDYVDLDKEGFGVLSEIAGVLAENGVAVLLLHHPRSPYMADLLDIQRGIVEVTLVQLKTLLEEMRGVSAERLVALIQEFNMNAEALEGSLDIQHSVIDMVVRFGARPEHADAREMALRTVEDLLRKHKIEALQERLRRNLARFEDAGRVREFFRQGGFDAEVSELRKGDTGQLFAYGVVLKAARTAPAYRGRLTDNEPSGRLAKDSFEVPPFSARRLIAGAVQGLSSKDSQKIVQSLQFLAAMQVNMVVHQIHPFLTHPSSEVRREAINALAAMGVSDSLSHLARRVRDIDDVKLADSIPADESIEIRMLLNAMMSVDHARATEMILDLYFDKSVGVPVKRYAYAALKARLSVLDVFARAIEEHRGNPLQAGLYLLLGESRSAEVRQWLEERYALIHDPAERLAAELALADLGVAERENQLVGILARGINPYRIYSKHVIVVLGRMALRNQDLKKKIIPILWTFVRARDSGQEQTEAIVALGRLGDIAVLPLLHKITENNMTNPKLVQELSLLIFAFRNETSVPVFIRLLSDFTQSRETWFIAMAFLKEAANGAAVTALEELTRDSIRNLKQTAYTFLYEIRARKAGVPQRRMEDMRDAEIPGGLWVPVRINSSNSATTQEIDEL
ncbi:MAG: methyltransferase domain-containing protein, partial [Candidatus Omnitrophota bacterium]|nr:methyltransferase domain-containing protein [Candidatus Omnitrophota bacterium]